MLQRAATKKESSRVTTFIDDSEDAEAWVEISRLEALERIERFMTEDVAAIEVLYGADSTPVGVVETFTWILVTDGDDQLPVLLMLRDPANTQAHARWFVHGALLQETPG